MSDLDIEAIRARWATVSPWPWSYWGGRGTRMHQWVVARTGFGAFARRHNVLTAPCHADHSCGHEAADAEAIAHAPQDVSALLAEVERLRAIEKVLRGVMGGWDECRGCPQCGFTSTETSENHRRLMAAMERFEIDDGLCPECGWPWDAPDPDYSDCAQHECHAKTDEKKEEKT